MEAFSGTMNIRRDVDRWLVMLTFALRAILAAAPLLSIGDVVLAQSNLTPTVAEDQRLLPYAKSGQLVGGLVQDPTCDRAKDAPVRLRPSRVWLQ